ncbi:MAG: lysophospholipid acyltransferase family protein [Bdellovibrionota bacterium]
MAVICILTYALLPLFPYKKTHSIIAAPGFSFVMKLILCPVNVTYDPSFDPKRRSVFGQNHVNLLDAFIASKAIPHVFCGLMHKWQFKIPIYGWMMAVSKGIPVDPKNPKGILTSMTIEAQKRKADGFSILTFPEGGRTLDGQVRKFKRGVFLMARDAGYPVVPVAVQGNFEVNQKGSRLFKPGKINVFVGPQMETTGLSDRELEDLAFKCETLVRNKVLEMRV